MTAGMRVLLAVMLSSLVVASVNIALLAAGRGDWRAHPLNPAAAGSETWGRRHPSIADRHGGALFQSARGGQEDAGGVPDREGGTLRRLIDWNVEAPGNAGASTTLDGRLQTAAVGALGSLSGVVVIVDVHTGDVLALADQTGPGSGPLAAWPPGSVMKLLSLGVMLDRGLIGPETTFPYEEAFLGIPNAIGACGGTVEEVLGTSCNSAVVRAGRRLAYEDLQRAASKTGFGTPEMLGIEPSRLPSPNDVDETTWPLVLIGQHEVRLNPLSAAVLVAAIGDGGRVHRPQLDATATTPTPTVLFSTDTAEILLEGMLQAASQTLGIKDPEIAIKTGTAESGLGYDHGWVVGLAPATKPAYAFSVVLPGEPGASYSGADAAEVAARLSEDFASGTGNN